MITAQFVAIWIAWVLAGGSPGPATMGIAGTAMTAGRASALVFALGILAGSAAWGIAAALGLSAIMLANAWVFEMIRYAGALYLGWLALKALRRAASSGPAAMGTPFSGSARTLFMKGAAIHITNPKAILSWGSIYAIVAPADATPLMLFGYFGLLYAGSMLIFLGYALLFSSAAVVRAYARAQRWFDLVFAGFFGFASFKILTARLE
ncbi:LysE family translocator [Roseobacter sinensis]|uniref:LysE family translocator n=1 Tax=Roseobacter sinensis TaxID=2931391 RepID=A0ABT3BDB1_9RHOB|nr:LysE family translocator [Roseobacter sp. WL0113]MCV3271567.1 LysE family translocator [Roseobacter sp. WL0113]